MVAVSQNFGRTYTTTNTITSSDTITDTTDLDIKAFGYVPAYSCAQISRTAYTVG